MGCKLSNQTNKQNWYCTVYLNFKHEQAATEPGRYYGTYRIGEQPWIAQGPTQPAKSTSTYNMHACDGSGEKKNKKLNPHWIADHASFMLGYTDGIVRLYGWDKQHSIVG